jgi:hypothetical protein
VPFLLVGSTLDTVLVSLVVVLYAHLAYIDLSFTIRAQYIAIVHGQCHLPEVLLFLTDLKLKKPIFVTADNDLT